jgi:hypothetical protein
MSTAQLVPASVQNEFRQNISPIAAFSEARFPLQSLQGVLNHGRIIWMHCVSSRTTMGWQVFRLK